MSLVPLHNNIDSLRYGRLKLTHQTKKIDGMGMLWTLLVHNNTWYVSLGPKMAVLGVRSVIVCVLSVVLAWDGLCILFGPAQTSRLLAGGFVRLSGPR